MVLFTKKKEPSAAFRALSTKHRGRMSFAFVDDTEKTLQKTFKLKSKEYVDTRLNDLGLELDVGASLLEPAACCSS